MSSSVEVSAAQIQKIFNAVYEANTILYHQGYSAGEAARAELGKALKILRQLGVRP